MFVQHWPFTSMEVSQKAKFEVEHEKGGHFVRRTYNAIPTTPLGPVSRPIVANIPEIDEPLSMLPIQIHRGERLCTRVESPLFTQIGYKHIGDQPTVVQPIYLRCYVTLLALSLVKGVQITLRQRSGATKTSGCWASAAGACGGSWCAAGLSCATRWVPRRARTPSSCRATCKSMTQEAGTLGASGSADATMYGGDS